MSYDEDRDEVFDEADDGEHIDGVCSACGERCTSVTEDHGIGVTEYFGVVARHREMVEVSPCCAEEVVEAEEELEEA